MSANEDLVDGAIGHQVDMQHYANNIVRQQVGGLNDDDDAMIALLLAALLAIPPGGATPARIDAALVGVMAVNAQAYRDIDQSLDRALSSVVEAEAEFQQDAMEAAQEPGGAAVVPLAVAGTFLAMKATPMMGSTIRDTLEALAVARGAAIRRAVQAGFVAGQTVEQIVAVVRSEAVLGVARRNLETVVRSSITHAMEYTKAAFYALNQNLVKAVVWLSVLDSATSSWCIARAGKRYTADAAHRPIGHRYDWGAGPGRYHYNCRSTFAPLVAGEVPKDNSFAAWLKKQPARVQDDVLGPVRGRMYRAGQVGVEGFVNNKGKLLTLEQLKAKNAGA